MQGNFNYIFFIHPQERYDNYQATSEDLEFSKGDLVWVLAKHDSGIKSYECHDNLWKECGKENVMD